MKTSCAFSALVLALLQATTPAGASGVVSLNLCTDELLVELAPARVAALSPLARDPALSVVAVQAASLPWVRADAEAVLRLHPDLVLAGTYGAQGTIAVLKRRGVHVAQFAEPTDFSGVAQEVISVASILGAQAAGAAMVANMRAALASVHPRNGTSAVFWQARGFSAAPGSFEDAALRAAGFSNEGTGRVIGVEQMVVHPPDVLVVEQAPAYPSLATNIVSHPALAGLRRIVVPPALLACAGPWSARAVEILAH